MRLLPFRWPWQWMLLVVLLLLTGLALMAPEAAFTLRQVIGVAAIAGVGWFVWRLMRE